jgi:hypothetical protein
MIPNALEKYLAPIEPNSRCEQRGFRRHRAAEFRRRARKFPV